MTADLLAALTTAAGLARTANDTGQPLSRREQARDSLHRWIDGQSWMFTDAAERVRQSEAVLRKYEYRMHASGCSSYWTTDDDVSEQFDSEKCDCGFAALLNPEEHHAR